MRASNAASVCLRCQLRRYTQQRPLSTPPFQHRRRYQSAAAVQLEDEDVPTALERVDSKASFTKKATAIKRHPKKKKLSSLWRPNRTAELGMDALGKPSEVLLLSPRDRKIPTVPKDSNEEPKESFYESVASEKQPTTWDQVKENIAHARHQIQSHQGPLTSEAWVELKKILSSGFTHSQLRRYLAEASPPDSEYNNKKRIRTAGKDPIIKLIAKHVWKYDLSPPSPKTAQQAPDIVDPKIIRLARFNKVQQSLIDRNPAFNIRKQASQNGVKISFEPKRTTVSGHAERAAEIVEALKAHVLNLKKTPRAIDGYARTVNNQAGNETIQILVETLARKYGIHASVTDKQKRLFFDIVCTANNQTSADRLKHEMYSALKYHNRKLPCMTSLTNNETIVLMPYYAPDVASAYPYPKALHRAQPLMSSSKELSVGLVSRLAHKLLFLKTGRAKRSSPLIIEYAAEYGLALVDDSKASVSASGTAITTLITKKSRQTIFHSILPLLPHFLANNNLRPAGSLETSVLNLRLCFTPLDYNTSGQVIEVELLGQDRYGGLTQNLRINRISLTRAQTGLALLQPSMPIDLKLSRRHKIHVYDAASPQASELHTAISTYVADKLTSPKLHETNATQVPPPFVPLFVDLPSPPHHSQRGSPPPSKQKVKKSDEKTVAEPLKGNEYFLSDFSIVETDRYEFELRNERYTLEHTNYIAQNPNVDPRNPTQNLIMPSPFRDRQCLVLRRERTEAQEEQPKKSASKSKGKGVESAGGEKTDEAHFDEFLAGVMYLAKQIGKEANALKQRMLQMK